MARRFEVDDQLPPPNDFRRSSDVCRHGPLRKFTPMISQSHRSKKLQNALRIGETRYVLLVTVYFVTLFVSLAFVGAWLRNWGSLRILDNAEFAMSYAMVWASPILGYICGKRAWKAVIAKCEEKLPTDQL